MGAKIKKFKDYDIRIRNCWQNINSRCYYPSATSYEYYGGKGIKNLLTFKDLVYLWNRSKASKMKRPSIHRKDSNQHYTIKNCTFIELKKNSSLANLKKPRYEGSYFNHSFTLLTKDENRLRRLRNHDISISNIILKGIELFTEEDA